MLNTITTFLRRSEFKKMPNSLSIHHCEPLSVITVEIGFFAPLNVFVYLFIHNTISIRQLLGIFASGFSCVSGLFATLTMQI